MAITKTKFINYIRCPRYAALDKIHMEKLDADVSYKDYQEEEKTAKVSEILTTMYDSLDEDLIDVKNEQLEAMMPYYKQVETLSAKEVKKVLKGNVKVAENTQDQDSFDCLINGIRYICYVDILNERKDGFDIVEVKATTLKKFLELGASINKEKISIFEQGIDKIFYLREECSKDFSLLPFEKYVEAKSKLYERLDGCGHYVYDLAVQRYIIEHDETVKNNENIKYYLAVLNSNYVYDGISDYLPDSDGNEVISLIDLTNVTKEMMCKIDLDFKRVESYIFNCDLSEYPIGPNCEMKKAAKCKYCKTCFSKFPEHNSIFNYLGGHNGFTDTLGIKHDRFDLANDGYLSILDVPDDYLNRRSNQIQKEVVKTNQVYQNIEKIKKGIECIEYPIYHLDFESFSSPVPRFRGEKAYSQSVFQFSLHIENIPGVCDKELDHYGYLAGDLSDQREELIKKMIEYIDTSKGTILVYNESFEKTRLKELAIIFPQYKTELLKMRSIVFDLLYLVKGNKKLFEELGCEDGLFNYYHPNLYGSFSIKKVLPVFSNLSYKDLEVGNGLEAQSTYASFPSLEKEMYKFKYDSLVFYCQQDTWAMYEVLEGLRKLVKENK
ncbi:MAG: DUF2779 domain-containing protein [Bacilli bacterium]